MSDPAQQPSDHQQRQGGLGNRRAQREGRNNNNPRHRRRQLQEFRVQTARNNSHVTLDGPDGWSITAADGAIHNSLWHGVKTDVEHSEASLAVACVNHDKSRLDGIVPISGRQHNPEGGSSSSVSSAAADDQPVCLRAVSLSRYICMAQSSRAALLLLVFVLTGLTIYRWWLSASATTKKSVLNAFCKWSCCTRTPNALCARVNLIRYFQIICVLAIRFRHQLLFHFRSRSDVCILPILLNSRRSASSFEALSLPALMSDGRLTTLHALYRLSSPPG